MCMWLVNCCYLPVYSSLPSNLPAASPSIPLVPFFAPPTLTSVLGLTSVVLVGLAVIVSVEPSLSADVYAPSPIVSDTVFDREL